MAYAEVPPELHDEYERTYVATGRVVLIAALAVVKDKYDCFLLVELDPDGKPLEDWFLDSPDEAMVEHPDLQWDRL